MTIVVYAAHTPHSHFIHRMEPTITCSCSTLTHERLAGVIYINIVTTTLRKNERGRRRIRVSSLSKIKSIS